MARLARIAGATALGLAWLAFTVAPAGATHAGEKMTVSKTTGLVDGDTVKVTFSGFVPGGVTGQHPNAKIVIAGQGTFTGIPDKLNFDEYANAPQVLVGPDGSGASDYVVFADHGTVQDGTTLNCNVNKCWLVVIQEPFLGPEGQPRYAATPITFGAGGGVPAPSTPAPTVPAATVPGANTTVAPVAETTTTAAVAETTTTTVAETTTTEATTTTTTPEDSTVTVEDEGSNTGLIVGIAVAAAAVLGGGAFLATRKKPPLDDVVGDGTDGGGAAPPTA